jgi:hypothetical protein
MTRRLCRICPQAADEVPLVLYQSRLSILLVVSLPLFNTSVFGGDRSDRRLTPSSPGRDARDDWESLEVPNFSVRFQAGQEGLAGRVGECAERVRSELYRTWFNLEYRPDWTPKCQVFLHTSVETYAKATENRASSSGYSTTHSSRGRVVSQRIDLLQDGSDLLRSVLPHELAHVLLSYHFVRRPLPLWAEEGLAVSAEAREMRDAHIKNLDSYARRGTLYSASELMTMREYPAEELRGVFYAQSVSLVEYFINRRGAVPFMEFLNLTSRQVSDAVLQRIYGLASLQELNQDWRASTITVDKLGSSH